MGHRTTSWGMGLGFSIALWGAPGCTVDDVSYDDFRGGTGSTTDPMDGSSESGEPTPSDPCGDALNYECMVLEIDPQTGDCRHGYTVDDRPADCTADEEYSACIGCHCKDSVVEACAAMGKSYDIDSCECIECGPGKVLDGYGCTCEAALADACHAQDLAIDPQTCQCYACDEVAPYDRDWRSCRCPQQLQNFCEVHELPFDQETCSCEVPCEPPLEYSEGSQDCSCPWMECDADEEVSEECACVPRCEEDQEWLSGVCVCLDRDDPPACPAGQSYDYTTCECA